MRDLDGSLTGKPGWSVFKQGMYYTRGLNKCNALPNWNMEMCRDHFAKVKN